MSKTQSSTRRVPASSRDRSPSAIPFVRGGQRADLLEGQVEIDISSAGLGWQGLHAERGTVNGWDVSEPAAVEGEYVALNLSSEPLVFEGGDGHGFQRITLPAGGVWVQPVSTSFRMVHSQHVSYGSLTIDADLFRRHAGRETLRLKQFYGHDVQSFHLVQSILEEARRGPFADPLIVEAACTALANHLARAHSERASSDTSVGGRLPARSLARVVDYIDAQRGRRLLIEELAALLNMSSAHFSRRFRATVGISPHRFVIQRRLARVRQALRDSDDKILAIAHENGFADQSHLTRAFRREFGMTPLQYRDAIR